MGLSVHDALARVRKMPVSSHSKKFFYKLLTETLSVTAWLGQKDTFVYPINCSLCDVSEIMEHFFFFSFRDAILFEMSSRE